MVDSRVVTLEVATPDSARLLSNLLGLYLHDMSEIFPIEVGADGRFQYDKLPLYWSEPEKRFAFLIRSGARLAGFALVTRGSPATDDPDHLDMAEFFVLRSQRRAGVGRQAAFLLWNRLPGQWVVRVSEANRAGLPFWHAIIQEYTRGAFSESKSASGLHGTRVFSFGSASPSATDAAFFEPAGAQPLDPIAALTSCIEHGGRALLLDHGALPAVFFDLGTGVAGELVQKLVNYGVCMAAVVPDLSDHSARFREFAREANQGRSFHFLATRQEAIDWLRSQTSGSRA